MPAISGTMSRFWQELKRRKVVHFLIAYVATCYAIIEFLDITSGRFKIPDSTFTLIYLLAALGLPVVIIPTWRVNRVGKIEDSVLETPASQTTIERPRHNLPALLTSFIGRKSEMQIVRQLLGKHRLVTLVGAGGCGKTRLAIEVATRLTEEYKDGVWFIDLAPVESEDLVQKEIAEVMSITEVPGQPVIETTIEKIRDMNLLVIMDNCEHLAKACAEAAGKLVHSVPGLTIIATSREALCVKGEQVWRVPSLSLIDPKTVISVEAARDSEAVQLFTDRARLNNPEFELEPGNVTEVAAICNKLDGIPLAVELVASRTRHMNTNMILERFAGRFDRLSAADPVTSKRQQTLHATIDWSYNMLSDGEKLLFARLTVFSGGFNLEAAEEVCSDEKLTKENILDLLSRLVDRSLVYTSKGADQSLRYNMLETLRNFALKKLTDREEALLIRRSHLSYYLGMAEQSYRERFESQPEWLAKLDLEHDNMIAALNWSEKNSPAEFVKLAGSIYWFWNVRGHLLLWKDYLERARSMDTERSIQYGRILFGLGHVLWYYGGMEGATYELMNEGLSIIQQYKDKFEEASYLSVLGALEASIGNYEAALPKAEKSLALVREIGKPGLLNHCLVSLCNVYVHSKKYDLGRPLCEELVISSEKLGQQFYLIAANHYLSDCFLGEGDYQEGERHYAHAMETALRFRNRFQAAAELQGMAFAIGGQKRWRKSIVLNAAAREQYRVFGVNFEGVTFWDEWIETYIVGAKKEVGEELSKKYEEEGRTMGFDKAVAYALDFDKD